MKIEDQIKALAEASNGDVAVVWVRRFGNFKVFSCQGDITPESTLGTGLVNGGDDILEGVEAATGLVRLGVAP